VAGGTLPPFDRTKSSSPYRPSEPTTSQADLEAAAKAVAGGSFPKAGSASNGAAANGTKTEPDTSATGNVIGPGEGGAAL
ncbi:MAG: hypothetical protein ABI444_10060, partial [Candidatus Kapaibacterium sp.]